MEHIDFRALPYGKRNRDVKVEIKRGEKYNIISGADTIYLQKGTLSCGCSKVIAAKGKNKLKSKRGIFIKIPSLPLFGGPKTFSFPEFKKTAGGYSYGFVEWHNPATGAIIQLNIDMISF